MVIRRSLLLIFLVFFVGLTLAFIFPYRQLIKDTLAEPLAYYLWYLQKVWRSLDSDIIWGFFILMIYALILMTFPTFRKSPQRPAQDEITNQGGQLEFWLYEVRRLVSQPEFSRLSVVELKKLVLDVIAFREQFNSRQEAEYWLMTEAHNIPPEVAALFERRISSKVDQPGRSLTQIWRSFWSWKNLRPTPRHQKEENIKAIIQFLENQFEMHP